MEDYAPLLWILFLVASMVFPAISKALKQQQKGEKHLPEAWPKTPSQPATPQSNPQSKSQMEARPFIHHELKPRQFTHLSAQSADSPKSIPTKNNNPMSDTTDLSKGLSEEFDLRTAVIYSEILKPKFDE